MPDREDDDRMAGGELDLHGGDQDRGREQGEPREDPFGRGFDRPEPGLPLEHVHEREYTGPYDRWRPRDYVFYSGSGYTREFIEPYKLPGQGRRYAGRGPRNYVRSDARILEDVSDRLTDHPDIDATDIEVRVDGGEVTLEGWVPHRAMKRFAEDVAYETRGVVDVHNHVRVGHPARRIPVRPDRREAREETGETGAGRRDPEQSPDRHVREAGDVGVRGTEGHSGSGVLGSTSFSERSRDTSSRAEDADAAGKQTK